MTAGLGVSFYLLFFLYILGFTTFSINYSWEGIPNGLNKPDKTKRQVGSTGEGIFGRGLWHGQTGQPVTPQSVGRPVGVYTIGQTWAFLIHRPRRGRRRPRPRR